VILVPDGELQVVNLATLPGGGSYLIETGPLIHLLSAERDLLGPEPGGTEGRGGLLALGGPDFDDRSLFAAASAPAERAAASAGGLLADGGPYRGRRSDCPEFQALRFEPLPGSGKEAEEVAALWRARSGSTALLLSGSGAGEAAFKSRAPGCRVLHLATHGFFLAGGCPSALPGSRGIGGLAPARALERPAARGEPPILLSGLVLAGANHRSAAGEGEEDGILTAEEIAALDLSSVEWAVLSSCQSGLGRVVKGEPLFGLRRAFQAAGARTVISSLWAVDDEAARLWMTALYRARLERGLGTAEAVRQAGLSILRARRAAGQSTHPFTWGGFIGCGG
jgi:CHAT domain-containing protein